jgi:threonyl-tRNA synthetase
MRNSEITIRATEHPSAHEAIQHLDVSGDDHAVAVGNKCLTLKQAEVEKIPLILVVGDKEAASGHVNVRTRGQEKTADVPLDDFVRRLRQLIADKSPTV